MNTEKTMKPTTAPSAMIKAGSITVAAGSRMRGHVEFGWDDEKAKIKPGLVGAGS